MIFEIKMKFKDDLFFSFWEVDSNLWNQKHKKIEIFMEDLLKKMNLQYEISKNQENIVYQLFGKPKDFFDLELYINKIIKF